MTDFDAFTAEVHPAADAFPMLGKDELAELSADIKANGLREPVVLQMNGRGAVLIDGRNRLAACKSAGIKPAIRWLEPSDDAVKFIVSANITRRNLSKGQRAMVMAFLFPEPEKGGRGNTGEARKLAETANFSLRRINEARTVLRYARDEAELVRTGAKSLDDALKIALDRKKSQEKGEEAMQELEEKAPDLAELVKEEKMRLNEAIGALRAREESDKANRYAFHRMLGQFISMAEVLTAQKDVKVQRLRGYRTEMEKELGMNTDEAIKLLGALDLGSLIAVLQEIRDVA